MTSNRALKQAAHATADETGVPYTQALREVAAAATVEVTPVSARTLGDPLCSVGEAQKLLDDALKPLARKRDHARIVGLEVAGRSETGVAWVFGIETELPLPRRDQQGASADLATALDVPVDVDWRANEGGVSTWPELPG